MPLNSREECLCLIFPVGGDDGGSGSTAHVMMPRQSGCCSIYRHHRLSSACLCLLVFAFNKPRAYSRDTKTIIIFGIVIWRVNEKKCDGGGAAAFSLQFVLFKRFFFSSPRPKIFKDGLPLDGLFVFSIHRREKHDDWCYIDDGARSLRLAPTKTASAHHPLNCSFMSQLYTIPPPPPLLLLMIGRIPALIGLARYLKC